MSYSEIEFREELINIFYNIEQQLKDNEFKNDMYYQLKEINQNLLNCNNQLQRIADVMEGHYNPTD